MEECQVLDEDWQVVDEVVDEDCHVIDEDCQVVDVKMEEEVSLKTEEKSNVTAAKEEIHEEEATDPYAEFLIIERQYEHKVAMPHYLTLMDSASFSDYQVDFYLNKTQIMTDHEYSAIIGRIPESFPPATGITKMQSYNKASELALHALSRRCYTVKYLLRQPEVTLSDIFKDLLDPDSVSPPIVKAPVLGNVMGTINPSRASNAFMTEDTQLQVDQAGQQESSLPSKYPGTMGSVASGSDTFASKMMKKMGWEDGGLGKDGEGIVGPIKSTLVAGCLGFGQLQGIRRKRKMRKNLKRKKLKRKDWKMQLKKQRLAEQAAMKKQKKAEKKQQMLKKKINRDPKRLTKLDDERFIHRVRLVIQDFRDNSENEDLVFAQSLSDFQRKLIHDIAGEYNLTSISFGHKNTRHLVLFRSHSVDEFLQKCIEKTKSNLPVNFQVIPPNPSKAPPFQGFRKCLSDVVKEENQNGNGFSAKTSQTLTEVGRDTKVSSGNSFSTLVGQILAEHKTASEKGKPQEMLSCNDTGFSNLVSKRLTEFKSVVVGQNGKELAPTTDFIILDRSYGRKMKVQNFLYYLRLMDSAKFSGYEVAFNGKRNTKNGQIQYSVQIKGFREDFPSASRPLRCDEMVVKNDAAKVALEILYQYCYTIKYNDNIHPITQSQITKRGPTTVIEKSTPSPQPVNQTSSAASPQPVDNLFPTLAPPLEKHQSLASAPPVGNLQSASGANSTPRPNSFKEITVPLKNFMSAGVVDNNMGLQKEVSEPLKGTNDKTSIAESRFGVGQSLCDLIGANAPVRNLSATLKANMPPETRQEPKKNKAPPPKLQNFTKTMKLRDKVRYWSTLYIKQFLENSEREDLIFCHGINKKHLVVIQEVVKKFNLRCLTLGYNNSAHMVLYRTISPRELLLKNIERQKTNPPQNFKIIPPLLKQE